MPKHASGPAPAPDESTASPAPDATCSVEAPSPPAAGEAVAVSAPPRGKDRGHTPLPTRLTPRLQNAIRIFSTGVAAKDACKQAGVGDRYFARVIKAPIGLQYLETITKRTEAAFIDKAAAVTASEKKLTVAASTVQNEIDEAVLESVQELRSIVKTSKSDQARALAAKELLDLAQAKKRYMESLTGKETDVEMSASDIAAYAAATSDLRALRTQPAELGEELRSPAADNIVRTIEAAVDPETIAAATAAVDQPSVASSVAENARPDGRLTDTSQPAPDTGKVLS